MDRNGGRVRRGKRRYRALVGLNVIYAALLAALAVAPRTPNSAEVSGRLAHAVAYGGQAILLYSVLTRRLSTGWALAAGCFGAVAFGALTEALQLLQPTRSAELGDIVADGCGVLVAGAVVVLLRHVRGEMGGGA